MQILDLFLRKMYRRVTRLNNSLQTKDVIEKTESIISRDAEMFVESLERAEGTTSRSDLFSHIPGMQITCKEVDLFSDSNSVQHCIAMTILWFKSY